MATPAVFERAIGTYNEYRSPMATATLLAHNDDRIVVRFAGPFCRMCCDYDYLEDLIYELEELGVDGDAIEIDTIYKGDESYLVKYSLD